MTVSTLCSVTDLELGWLCGMLEGEGCFQAPPPSHPEQVRVVLITTDKDVAERVAALMGVKKVGAPPSRRKQPHHKQAFVVARAGRPAAALMHEVRPHMSARRQAAIDYALSRSAASTRTS